jgi:hypothetical protein
MCTLRGLSDGTGYAFGAGARGPKGSLAPADVAPDRCKGVSGLVGSVVRVPSFGGGAG